MTDISKRLREMRTAKGQSLRKLEREAADEFDRLFHALKRISNLPLAFSTSAASNLTR